MNNLALITSDYQELSEIERENRQKLEELEISNRKLSEETHSLSVKTSMHGYINKLLNENINKLFDKHIQTINNLCAQFFDPELSAASKAAVYGQVRVELEQLKDKKNLEQIVEVVNNNGGIIERIKEAVPDISNEDLTFIAMVIAGFNTRIITVITGLKPQGVYTKKRRLFAKIKDAGIEIEGMNKSMN